MGHSIDPVERDRELFNRNPGEQLFTVLRKGDTRLLVKAVTKLIQLQIATEELARHNGLEINDERLAAFIDQSRDHINELTERGVTAFICSIVSQEG